MSGKATISVRYDPSAGLGNNMLQYLLARVLSTYAPHAEIVGDGLPEWGIELKQERSSINNIRLSGHIIPFKHAIRKLREGIDLDVQISSLAARLEYFGHALDLGRKTFRAPDLITGYGTDHIVFHVRTGDVYKGTHPNYTPLPISYYRHLVSDTGLKPAFVGQIEDNEYCDVLRKTFPDADFRCGSVSQSMK